MAKIYKQLILFRNKKSAPGKKKKFPVISRGTGKFSPAIVAQIAIARAVSPADFSVPSLHWRRRQKRLASVPRTRNVSRDESDGYAGMYGLNGKRLRGAGVLAALWASVQANVAMAQDSLADPQGSGAIVSAVRWLEGTLLGTVATVVAVIAVASVGFLMLTGRINWRYGATVILGCFILFGAASIVAGIQSTASAGY